MFKNLLRVLVLLTALPLLTSCGADKGAFSVIYGVGVDSGETTVAVVTETSGGEYEYDVHPLSLDTGTTFFGHCELVVIGEQLAGDANALTGLLTELYALGRGSEQLIVSRGKAAEALKATDAGIIHEALEAADGKMLVRKQTLVRALAVLRRGETLSLPFGGTDGENFLFFGNILTGGVASE